MTWNCYSDSDIAHPQVRHIFAQELSLPEDVLERSVSNKGDTSRFRKLFTKLRAGVPRRNPCPLYVYLAIEVYSHDQDLKLP